MYTRPIHPVQTTHRSGTGMIPHNWTREMPNDPRYGTDKPTLEDVTNYSQVQIFHTKEGHSFCEVFINHETLF